MQAEVKIPAFWSIARRRQSKREAAKAGSLGYAYTTKASQYPYQKSKSHTESKTLNPDHLKTGQIFQLL